MYLSWQERLIHSPELKDIDNWPKIFVYDLPRSIRNAFLRNYEIINRALNGEKQKDIADSLGVSQPRISQLLNKCLAGEDQTPPLLTQALIPFKKTRSPIRQKPLSQLSCLQGSPGSFQYLLKVAPRLKANMDQMIELAVKGSASSQRLSAAALHGEFKRSLAEIHWPTNQYPYTHASCAYESVRLYLKRKAEELQLEKLQKQNNLVNNSSKQLHQTPLQHVQLDEQIIDLGQSIYLDLDGEVSALRTSRASLLLLIDEATDCILSYSLVPTKNPTHVDLLELFNHCLETWRPKQLQTPGMFYSPGSEFPNSSETPLALRFFNVHLDNAKMHMAKAITHFLCEELGCVMHFGLPGQPKARHWVERAFKRLNDAFSHRPDSTTGSHPHDQKRESNKNQKRPPRITYQAVQDAIEVTLTHHNAKPQKRLGGESPIGSLKSFCANSYSGTWPTSMKNHWKPFLTSKVVKVCWYKNENRIPHVNFCHLRYTGLGLTKPGLTNKKIRIEFDRRDIRRLRAYTQDGQDLGILEAPKSWQLYPHSIVTRRLIYKYVRSKQFHAKDPLSGYFRHLLDHRENPKDALQLLRIYQEFSSDKDIQFNIKEGVNNLKPKQKALITKSGTPHWNLKLANQRK